jgi:hypothetical protein
MAWTAEKKRQVRAKRKAEQAQKEIEFGRKMILLSPTNSELKKPYSKEHVGKTKVDYGGHQKALNFPLPDPEMGEVQLALVGDPTSMHNTNNSIDSVVNRIGDLSIGLVYEGDWKAKSKYAGKGVRKMCLKSEQYLDFLLHVKEMLHPMVHSTLQLLMDDSLRVNILCGARTLAHTDSYRGNTPNMLYIVGNPKEEPGWLCYDPFPRFKVSVVKIKGHYFIPHSYSEASNEVRCIGAHPNKPNKVFFYIFQSNVIDCMEPVGDLPYGVVGWKANGDIQVVPEYEGVCLYTKPLIFQTYKWDYVLRDAFANPAVKPWKRIVRLDLTDRWMQFQAYTYRHWWTGNNMVVRYHAFFRTVREVPTSSNVIRKGNRINYIQTEAEALCNPEPPTPDNAVSSDFTSFLEMEALAALSSLIVKCEDPIDYTGII